MKHKSLKKVLSMALASTLVLGTVQSAMGGTHIVQEGEWLSKIAPKYDTTWQNLADINKLENPDLIYPDQVLQVPDKGAPAPVVDADVAELSALDVVDITTDNIFDETKFDPDVTEYEVTVQSDIYGVLLKPEADGEITVTCGATTYQADTWGNITPDYNAGEELPYKVVEGDGGYEGYMIPLDQSYEGYDSEFVQPVYINVEEDGVEKEYTVTITRESLKDVYDCFVESKYTASNGETIPYQLYVPSDYKEGEKLPVVFALHGSGQRVQPTFMVLKRYQMATIWAADSEAGHNRCIVLAPQCDTAENGRNWTDLMRTDLAEKSAYNPDPKLIAAYELLEKTIEDYNADTDRIYMTGLSAGGYACFAMAVAHPEMFAALVPVAGGVDVNADLSALKDTPVWIIQATNDPLVSYETVYKPTVAALKEAGVEVVEQLYADSEVFYPSGHFSWTPGYADEEMRDWLFAQKRNPVLTSLDIVDITTKDIFAETSFDPAKTEYTVNVQSDIYGVLLKADAGLKVTADTTCKSFTYGVNYEAGTAIPYDANLGGYVVQLDQTYEGYDVEFVQTATIEANDTEYTVKIVRDCDTEIYELFEQKVFNYTTEAGKAVALDYNYYEPENVEGKELPVVFVLHGHGQSANAGKGTVNQPTDMILKRYQMASIWAADSEADPDKECIVIAPQMNTLNNDDNADGWGNNGLSFKSSGEAAYALLEEVLEKDYADVDRVYVMGCSMGGVGTWTMLQLHPETFAAAIPVCGKVDITGYDFGKLESLDGQIYVAHAEGDKSVPYSAYEEIVAGLDKAGIDYESKTWTAEEVFFPQPHFSWTPMFADEEVREWLFDQTR